MKNLLPINGRIAIVDNEINEALPLMRTFSKNQIPYTFFKGDDLKYLPNDPLNDIRILFLDLNLLNNRTASEKEVRGMLYSVLSKIISPINYPYCLIYWSKQEKEYTKALEGLFENELKELTPIRVIPFIKSDFFPNFGDEEQQTEKDIIQELDLILQSMPSYSYLLSWENQIHKASDHTLKDIFGVYHGQDSWDKNVDYTINKLSHAYLGQHFIGASSDEKIKGCFNTFNSIFFDTLESSLYSLEIQNTQDLTPDLAKVDETVIKGYINYRINMSENISDICEPGVVFQNNDNEKDPIFRSLLHLILSLFKIKERIKRDNPDIVEAVLKSDVKKEFNNIKDEIKQSWIKIGMVVSPLCDYAQNKNIYDRVVKGVLIEAKYIDYLDDKSDAIFISPIFYFHDKDYFIVLDYRYFVTKKLKNEDNIRGLFRVRQQLLSEVQSKLARHINRQGILYLS
ncbi:MAG: hypothetical protein PHT78_12005 [Desulfitobacteriaceae bacterium]|nr:hypothetical protein [Desulfitobacteriaceae bacterium]